MQLKNFKVGWASNGLDDKLSVGYYVVRGCESPVSAGLELYSLGMKLFGTGCTYKERLWNIHISWIANTTPSKIYPLFHSSLQFSLVLIVWSPLILGIGNDIHAVFVFPTLKLSNEGSRMHMAKKFHLTHFLVNHWVVSDSPSWLETNALVPYVVGCHPVIGQSFNRLEQPSVGRAPPT